MAIETRVMMPGASGLYPEERPMNRSLRLEPTNRRPSRWAMVPVLSLGLCSFFLFLSAAGAQTRERDAATRPDHICQEERIR